MNTTLRLTNKLDRPPYSIIKTPFKRRISLFLLLAMLFVFPAYNYAQQNLAMGKEFYLTYANKGINQEFQLLFGSHKNSTVTITMPNGTTRTLAVSANFYTGYTLSGTDLSNFPVLSAGLGIMGESGISISSTEDICVFSKEIDNGKSDVSLIFPKPYLGNNYTFISYTTPIQPTFGFVSSETFSEITFPVGTGTSDKKRSLYCWANVAPNGGTGTSFFANKPIAALVFGGDLSIEGSSKNFFMGQLIPNEKQGKDYFIPVTNQGRILARITATSPNTVVNYQGEASGAVTLTNAGDFKDVYGSSSSKGIYISCTNPVAVGSFMLSSDASGVSGYNASFSVSPSLSQFSVEAMIPVATNEEVAPEFALLVVPTGAKNKTKLSYNGDAAQSLSSPVWIDNPNGYSYCNYRIWKGLNYFTNPNGLIAYAYGNTKQSTNFSLGAIGNMNPKIDPVIDYPDNIIEADCYGDPPPTKWDIRRSYMSDQSIHTFSQVYAGDVDGDGEVEFVTKNYANDIFTSNKILIYNDLMVLKYSINIPQTGTSTNIANSGDIAIADVDKDGKSEIYTVNITSTNASSAQILCYVYDSSLPGKWKAKPGWVSSLGTLKQVIPFLSIGDINNDGTPEILAGTSVYNAQTGAHLVDMPAGSIGGYPLPFGGNLSPSVTLLSDIDHDGTQEVVAGSTVYKVNITNANGMSGNSATVLYKLSNLNTSRYLSDGFTSVADLDLDGNLEVIVTNKSVAGDSTIMYAWKPQTQKLFGNVMRTNKTVKPQIARAFIGDMDGDGYPEVAAAYSLSSSAGEMICWHVDTGTKDKFLSTPLWKKGSTDESGMTNMTMFDFNQDGKQEVVYRDMSNIRIINGSTGTNVATFACKSWTALEGPIIVDAHNSGHASIVVSGAPEGESHNGAVRLMMFESITSGTWAPSRKVWNQHAYNSVNVNQDLTIPIHNFNPSTTFAGLDGILGTSDDIRPFNAFLQQQTTINQDGVPFFTLPNLEFSGSGLTTTYYDDGDSLVIKVEMSNIGDAGIGAPIYITAYKDIILPANAIGLGVFPGDLNVGESTSFSFRIDNFSAKFDPAKDIVINLNDSLGKQPYYQECNYSNNTASEVVCKIRMKIKSYIACPGAVVNMEVIPIANASSYKWYDAPTGGNLLGTGTNCKLTKNSSANQSVWVEVVLIDGIMCERKKVDVLLSENCGSITPSGCALTGGVIWKEDFDHYGNGSNPTSFNYSPIPLDAGRTTYQFFDGVGNHPSTGDPASKYVLPLDGEYSLAKYAILNSWKWRINNDHTSPLDLTRGRFMLVNADYKPGEFYTHVMDNLCEGTHLNFYAWIADCRQASECIAPNCSHPNLTYCLVNPGTNDTIVQYTTGNIPGATNTTADWRQWGFGFTVPQGVSSVKLVIRNNQNGGVGNDLGLDDIEIRFCAPPVVLSGAANYCPDDNINLTANYTDDGTFGGSQQTRWLYSSTGDLSSFSSWSVVGNGSTLNKPIVEGYYRAVVGLPSNLDNKFYNCCALSNSIRVGIVPNLMYWNKTATNSNWNDPNNWVDANDNPLNAVPRSCTDVHIPGNANFYPALDLVNTVRNTTYGEPACRDITYHFGSEVAKPHYLTYRNAKIQYNFGYFDGSNTYKTDGDPHSATPMKRGQWYALAAPLKKIVSGDFSVGGFPNMWQEGYRTTPGHSGELWGEWYAPENTNALEVGAGQHYSICIWGGNYLPAELGENNHTNLNAMQGIFEMPYFENTPLSTLHRIHDYNTGSKTSSFKYYWFHIPGLPIESSKAPGTIVRGNEAYRYVFEDATNKPQNDFKITVPAGDEVLVGNVFLSSLDFIEFFNRNSAVIENYYRLYINNSWETYSIPTGSPILSQYIASFQGFLIKTKGSKGSNTDIYFPMSASVTRPSNKPHQLKSSLMEELPANVLYLNAKSAKGNSWATIGVNVHPEENHVSKMFAKKAQKDQSLQLYTVGKDRQKNTTQYEFGSEIVIPFGVLCDTVTDVNLSITNIERLNAATLILEDTKRDREYNLFETNELPFVFEPNDGDRFILRIGRAYAPTGIEQATEKQSLNVYTSGKTLHVYASKEIAEVTVASLQGITVHAASIHQTSYVKEIPFSTGTYIVTVKTKNGETNVTKVIIK